MFLEKQTSTDNDRLYSISMVSNFFGIVTKYKFIWYGDSSRAGPRFLALWVDYDPRQSNSEFHYLNTNKHCIKGVAASTMKPKQVAFSNTELLHIQVIFQPLMTLFSNILSNPFQGSKKITQVTIMIHLI